MDDVSIWFYRKSQETNLPNIPTNSEINEYINNAQRLKLLGKFKDSWEDEDYANQLILDFFYDDRKFNEANAYKAKSNMTQEMRTFIELERNFTKATNAMYLQGKLLEDHYASDKSRYGKTVAEKKKKEAMDKNTVLNVVNIKTVNDYNNAVLKVNTELGQEKILAQERKKEADLQALKASRSLIRNVQVEEDKINATVDTPMTVYMRKKTRSDTANEINESTQSTYMHDVVYVFFKVLLFVILGVLFYYWMKDQNPKEIIEQVKETTKVVSEKVNEGVKTLKQTIKDKGTEMTKEKELIKATSNT